LDAVVNAPPATAKRAYRGRSETIANRNHITTKHELLSTRAAPVSVSRAEHHQQPSVRYPADLVAALLREVRRNRASHAAREYGAGIPVLEVT